MPKLWNGSQSNTSQKQPRQAECNYMSSTCDAENVQKNNFNKFMLRSMTRNMFKLHYQQFVITTLHEPAGQSPAGQEWKDGSRVHVRWFGNLPTR